MIHVVPPRDEPLTSAEQFGLDLLIDLSRAIPVILSSPNVVHLEVKASSRRAVTVVDCIAHEWYIEVGDGKVLVDRSALDVVCSIAGASREQASMERDSFGRIPSLQSPLAAARLEREPVISRAAVLIRKAVIQAAGSRIARFVAPWPDGRRWAAAITHDLDVVSRWPVFTALRFTELARKGELARLGAVLTAAAGTITKNPVRAGVQRVLDSEREHALSSTWFVLCGTPSLSSWRHGDLTYLPESPQSRHIFDDILRYDGEIGLHGSFETLDRDDAFIEQRERLAKLTSGPVEGVRQHFLRLDPATTPRAMAAAGFAYDSTQGFADRNGFRLGVADVVPVWDARAQETTGLREIPFCWMDRALSKYRGIENPDIWVKDALELATECRKVDGLWVGVWHPNLVPALGFPGAPEAFTSLLDSLSAEGAFFGTLRDILNWRSARRSIRVRSVSSEGDVVAEPLSVPFEFVLEDANGRVMGKLDG